MNSSYETSEGAREKPNDFPPMFVGGSARSGTNMIVDMIGIHPWISPVYETNFVLKLIEVLHIKDDLDHEDVLREFDSFAYKWSKPLPKIPDSKPDHEHYVHGEHHINFDTETFRDITAEFLQDSKGGFSKKRIRDYIRGVFDYHASKDDKPYWVNKVPRYVNHPDVLLNWFPDMKFIHMVRDGRDSIVSMRKRDCYPDDIERLSRRWGGAVSSGIRFGKRHSEHYIEVKYEELVTSPEETLKDVLQKLCGETTDKEVSDWVGLIIEQAVDPDPSRIGNGQKELTESELNTFEEIAGHIMDHLNYF
ncbi:MAG: sulfotransferase [bacterium]